MVLALVQSLRPKQWIKNLILFAGYVFSITERQMVAATEIELLTQVVIGFFLFSLTSGVVYLVNDILDKDADRLHPEKCNRPIASGRLPVPAAIISASFIAFGSLFAAFMLSQPFFWMMFVYLAIFILYSFRLKKIVILDVLLIAIGFMIRAVAGAAIINQGISVWLIVCTLFLALFLGFSKRLAELSKLTDEAVAHRKTLKEYSVNLLNILVGSSTTLAIISYTLYCLSDRSIAHVGLDSLMTIPIVIFGVFRYLYLVTQRLEGADPATVLLSDYPLLSSVAAWILIWVALILWQPALLKDVVII